MVPQELVDAYTEIVKAEADPTAAAAHMVNFLLDAQKISEQVQKAIEAARVRATPAQ